MENLNWRLLICVGAIPSLIFLFAAILFLNESPSFLLVNGRRQEAERVLTSLRDDNGVSGVPIDLGPEPEMAVQTTSSQQSSMDKLRIVLGRHFLYTTITVCVSCFNLNFLFYGGLYAFPQVLPHLELQLSPAVNLMLGAISEIPGYLAGVILCSYMSRKSSMLLYLLAVLISVLCFSFSVRDPIFAKHLEWLLQIGLLGHKTFTAVGFLVVYVYAVEVYPTVVRTTGAALTVTCGRLGAIVVAPIFENLRFATTSDTLFFSLTAGICAVNAMLVLFLPFETKDAVLQDHLDEHQSISKPM